MQASLATLCNLRSDSSTPKLDYLLPRVHDLVEQELAEYLACRDELQRIADLHPSKSPQADLGRLAALKRAECDIALTSATLEDAVLRQSLNQEFYRSGIPAGTCDEISHELTDSSLQTSLPDVRPRIDGIIRQQSLLLPAVENEFWHAPPTRYLATTSRAAGNQLHRSHGSLVAHVGRLKNPAYQPLEFTPDQRQQIHAALQPGDVLLTYTAGFASNYFIPGSFKHAATFVGTEEDRRRVGIPAEALAPLAGPSNQRLAHVLRQTQTAESDPADVVESVAEGVLLNQFDRILTTRINRLVVLRPCLSAEERSRQLVDVLSYVGDEYDFSFDLTDGSDQVCTEVVYRSLQGRGGIAFPLTKHAGRFTLTADEILKYHLHSGAGQFETVLTIDEDPRSPGKAQLHFADEGQAWITKLPGMGD